MYVENYDIPEVMWDIEKIHDWGKRIKNYTEEQKRFYNNLVPKIEELKNIAASTQDWQLLVDKK